MEHSSIADFKMQLSHLMRARFPFLYLTTWEEERDRLAGIPNRLELRISPDGKVLVNGLAETKDLEALFRGLL